MDTQFFTKLTEQAFGEIVAAYATASHHDGTGGIGDDDQKRLLNAILQVFRAPTMGGKPVREVPVFQRVQEPLAAVFCDQNLDWDLDARREVYGQWREIFRDVFPQCVETLQAPALDIWDFITPTITLPELLNVFNRHVDVYQALYEPLNVQLDPEEVDNRQAVDCLRPKGPRPRGWMGEQPVGTGRSSIKDKHFYHICPYCSKQDRNPREDHLQDHMESNHNKYKQIEKWERNFTRYQDINRKRAGVLFEMIRRERALLNCTVKRHFLARDSRMYLREESHIKFPVPADEQANDLQHIRNSRSKLAAKLIEERKKLIEMDWDSWTRHVTKWAWYEAKKKDRGVIDWGNV